MNIVPRRTGSRCQTNMRSNGDDIRQPATILAIPKSASAPGPTPCRDPQHVHSKERPKETFTCVMKRKSEPSLWNVPERSTSKLSPRHHATSKGCQTKKTHIHLGPQCTRAPCMKSMKLYLSLVALKSPIQHMDRPTATGSSARSTVHGAGQPSTMHYRIMPPYRTCACMCP